MDIDATYSPSRLVGETPDDTMPANTSGRHSPDLANVCFYLFVLGGIAGVAQLSNPLPFGAGFEMVAAGKNLAESGTLANPFRILDTGPTSVNPPLYPLFLGLLFKLFGSPGVVLIAAAIGNMVMNALTASWLPRVSLAVFGSFVPGVVAALLWLGAVQLMPAWDVSYTVAGLTLFCWYSVSAIKSYRPVRPGLLAAMVVMLNPACVIVLLPWLSYLVLIHTRNRKRAILFAGAVLVIICIPVSLWMLRNSIVLGAPVLRTNLGMTLYVSNNGCAQPSLIESALVGCYGTHHPNDSILEAQAVRSEGEVNYDRSRVAASINWIQANPARFQQLTISRFRQFWLPPPGRNAFPAYVTWLGTVLSIPGLILMAWRRDLAALLIGCVLLVYPVMYYIVVSDVRYRYPVLWLTFLAAGYLIHAAPPLAHIIQRMKVVPRSC